MSDMKTVKGKKNKDKENKDKENFWPSFAVSYFSFKNNTGMRSDFFFLLTYFSGFLLSLFPFWRGEAEDSLC